MNRRESLKLSGLAIGMGISGSALISIISACKQDISAGVNPSILSKDEFLFVEEIAETILPKSNTPGAKDAGVTTFIDHFISRIYTADQLKDFKLDLSVLQQKCQSQFNKALSKCSLEQKKEFVKSIESDKYAPAVSIWGNPVHEGDELPFYKKLKSMILWGYFSSEKVGKEVLLYQQLAPDYQGCVDVNGETRLASI
ncbi:MAG: gluconate 2-dehydrogenase subunit 3 family protein [Saprospiraceae bacterium]